jgi:serine/threonine-protein kinase
MLIQEVALNEEESEIVRLELLEMARSAIQQYATKFKVDGITEEQLQSMYGVIAETVKSIDVTTDKTEEKKNNTISMLDDTESAIKTAYVTSKGGSEV